FPPAHGPSRSEQLLPCDVRADEVTFDDVSRRVVAGDRNAIAAIAADDITRRGGGSADEIIICARNHLNSYACPNCHSRCRAGAYQISLDDSTAGAVQSDPVILIAGDHVVGNRVVQTLHVDPIDAADALRTSSVQSDVVAFDGAEAGPDDQGEPGRPVDQVPRAGNGPAHCGVLRAALDEDAMCGAPSTRLCARGIGGDVIALDDIEIRAKPRQM